MQLAVLPWPERDAERMAIARAGLPRLLLVGDGADAPIVIDDVEDWIRVPAPDSDVLARIKRLEARWRVATASPPRVDDEDTMHFAGRRVNLAPLQARLARELAAHVGSTVERGRLVAAGWPDGGASRNALDVHVARVRRRVTTLGLVIRTRRTVGYALEPADADAILAAEAERFAGC
jgi:hypothetical protein